MNEKTKDAFCFHGGGRLFRLLILAWVCLMMPGLCGCRKKIVLREAAPESETQTRSSEKQEQTQGLAVQTDNMQEESAQEQSSTSVPDDQAQEQDAAQIYVHVLGEVNAPSVYALPEGARVFQAVEAAGGFTEAADAEWCNQALPLADADRLRIYSTQQTATMIAEGLSAADDFFGIERSGSSTGNQADGQSEISGQAGDDGAAQTQGGGQVNLNTASKEELMTLSGIGERRAEDIIAYRERTGGFSSVEELTQISGIGQTTLAKIIDNITV